MSDLTITVIEREGLTEDRAAAYVGGRSVLAALQAAYPDHVKPFARWKRVKVYRKAALSLAMEMAEASGALVGSD